MMTEKFALVAVCCLWVSAGLLAVPRVESSAFGPLPWVWIAACPLAFWLGHRSASSGLRLARILAGLAGVLWLGVVLGVWSIHPNDLASLLALLLPWWLVPTLVGAADSCRSDTVKLGSWALATALATGVALGVVAALFWTGSRGGLLAGLVGTLASLVLVSRRRRLFGLVLLLAAVLALAILPATQGTALYDSGRGWIRDHDAEGFTWSRLGSGRPTLWRQATRVVEDFPLFGTGPGSYGVLVPDVYVPPIRRFDLHDPTTPRTPRVDDAHSLYLESAVSFGLPFLLAFLGLSGLGLARQASLALPAREPAAATTRIESAAAFGGLLAYLLHGLVDCAAPGTIVYAAAWAALGHACAGPRPSKHAEAASWRRPVALTAVCLLAAALAVYRWLPAERLHRQAVGVILGSDEVPDVQASGTCRDAWWRERLAVARGDTSAHPAVDVARCAPERLAEIAALSPRDLGRAKAVLAARPGHADALLWRVWARDAQPAESLATGYFQVFARRPGDADAKMEFLNRVGRDWQQRRPYTVLALQAHACAHGDPGANACLRAGRLAQQLDLGNDVADSFFLASEWPGARRLASK